jgi:hypothetical protein
VNLTLRTLHRHIEFYKRKLRATDPIASPRLHAATFAALIRTEQQLRIAYADEFRKIVESA